MSVATAISRLAARFMAASPAAPAEALTRVIEDSSARFDAGDLPLAVLRFEPEAENYLKLETVGSPGLGRHDYRVQFFVLIGVVTGPDIVPSLHEKAKEWGYALLVALASDIKLGGAVDFIGGWEDQPGVLATYQVRPITWWDGESYYGLVGSIPVCEKPSVTIG